jgi:hypothetical protein
MTLRQYERYTVLGIYPGQHWYNSRVRTLTQAPAWWRSPAPVDPAVQKPKQLCIRHERSAQQNQNTEQDTEQWVGADG